MAIRWTFKRDFSFKNDRFAKIYRFYVIETPVSGTSYRGKTFKEYGINMTSLNAALKRTTPFLKKNWFEETMKDIEQRCLECGILENVDFSSELAIHTNNKKHCTGKTDSMFYAIRCAFAHGSFDIHTYKNEDYYILENRDGNSLKARMILKESTLLSWIDVVKSSPKPHKSKRK